MQNKNREKLKNVEIGVQSISGKQWLHISSLLYDSLCTGLAFPTCLSINSIICHFSPLPSDSIHSDLTLSKGDVVKIVIGAQIDGYASISAETCVNALQ